MQSIFIILVVITLFHDSDAYNLTKEENEKRLKTCGYNLNHDRDSSFLQSVFLVDNELDILEVASATLISPRHLLTSSRLINKAHMRMFNELKKLKKSVILSIKISKEDREHLKLWPLTGHKVANADVIGSMVWTKEKYPMNIFLILELEKDVDIPVPCLNDDGLNLRVGEKLHFHNYVLKEPRAEYNLFRHHQEIKVTWIAEQHFFAEMADQSSVKGGAAVKLIDLKSHLIGMPTSDDNLFMDISDHIYIFCGLYNICPGPKAPRPVTTTTKQSTSTRIPSTLPVTTLMTTDSTPSETSTYKSSVIESTTRSLLSSSPFSISTRTKSSTPSKHATRKPLEHEEQVDEYSDVEEPEKQEEPIADDPDSHVLFVDEDFIKEGRSEQYSLLIFVLAFLLKFL